jgi:hypothetical protein
MMERRMKMRARLTATLRIAVVVAALMVVSPTQRTEASSFEDEELVVSNQGSTILLPGSSHRSNISEWLNFETDECGLLRRIERGRSMLRRSAVSDGENDDEADDEDSVGEVPDGPWADAQDWLYDHPEIAVVSEAVDKTCEDVGSPLDLELDPGTYAKWDRGGSAQGRWQSARSPAARDHRSNRG